MHTVDSVLYSQSIHEIADFNFQFLSQFGLQVGNKSGKCQGQFSIICVPVWERRLAEKKRKKRKKTLSEQ